jgi:hypothetical protein
VSKVSPTQRTLKHLRAAGYFAEVTERWNPFAKIRQDLFGFVDVLAIRKGETLAVQCTSLSNMSSRVKKIAEHENTPKVRDAGWQIHVHGWDGSKLKVKDVS